MNQPETTPHPSTQLPEEVKPPYNISERKPVFPCWLWDEVTFAWSHWGEFTYTAPRYAPPLNPFKFTHWHPDQPTAPTTTPYLAPRPPAPRDAPEPHPGIDADHAGDQSGVFSDAPADSASAQLAESKIALHAFYAEVIESYHTQLAAMREERDAWQAKFTDLNNSLMAELRDPSGTIWEHAKALQKERDELRADKERLTAFSTQVLNGVKGACAGGEMSEEDEAVMEAAAKFGIGNVQRVKYDPAIHGEDYEVEPGGIRCADEKSRGSSFSRRYWKTTVSVSGVDEASEIKARFSALVTRWRNETGASSLLEKKYAHPAYQEILTMGTAAIPLLLSEMKNRPDRWFVALRTLAKYDAAEKATSFNSGVVAWLDWGREKGFKF